MFGGNISIMKHLFSLLLVAMLASVATVSAQDTLKIKGQEKALVVKVLSVMEGKMLYSDFVSQETSSVDIWRIERLYIKEESRRIQLSQADENMKTLIRASSPKEFVAKMMNEEDPSALLTWTQHLDHAGSSYNGAAILGALSMASLAAPIAFSITNASLNEITGGLSIAFAVGSFIMYLDGNSHLRKAARKAENARVGVVSTPTGVGVAFRFNR
jgi:hypothetical protein